MSIIDKYWILQRSLAGVYSISPSDIMKFSSNGNLECYNIEEEIVLSTPYQLKDDNLIGWYDPIVWLKFRTIENDSVLDLIYDNKSDKELFVRYSWVKPTRVIEGTKVDEIREGSMWTMEFGGQKGRLLITPWLKKTVTLKEEDKKEKKGYKRKDSSYHIVKFKNTYLIIDNKEEIVGHKLLIEYMDNEKMIVNYNLHDLPEEYPKRMELMRV